MAIVDNICLCGGRCEACSEASVRGWAERERRFAKFEWWRKIVGEKLARWWVY